MLAQNCFLRWILTGKCIQKLSSFLLIPIWLERGEQDERSKLFCWGCSTGFAKKLPPFSIFIFIIHQIFSLARDWSKRVTWLNILQLKLGNIRGYSPSDIPQFPKLQVCNGGTVRFCGRRRNKPAGWKSGSRKTRKNQLHTLQTFLTVRCFNNLDKFDTLIKYSSSLWVFRLVWTKFHSVQQSLN